MNKKIIIPKIDFEFWNSQWNANFEKTNVYSNHRIDFYNDFHGTMKECETQIMSIVDNAQIIESQIPLLIDLINKWGGKSSRMFYIPNRKTGLIPRESFDLKQYIKALELSKQKSSLAFSEFQKIEGIGPSFAGKHAMFCSKGMLIILDNKIAGTLGFKSPKELLSNFSYEDVLIEFENIRQSTNKFLNNTEIERALFAFHSNFFDNANSKLNSNPKITVDFKIALELARILKIVD
jgi:hypothetical protein